MQIRPYQHDQSRAIDAALDGNRIDQCRRFSGRVDLLSDRLGSIDDDYRGYRGAQNREADKSINDDAKPEPFRFRSLLSCFVHGCRPSILERNSPRS